MNYHAYNCIHESMKNEKYLAIYYYDSMNYIYKQNNHIVVKDIEKEVFYNCDEFDFKCNKPIEKITVIQDKYGFVFSDIFNKKYLRAALTIQRAWKK